MKRNSLALWLALVGVTAVGAQAPPVAEKKEEKAAEKKEPPPEVKETQSVTRHTMPLDGKQLAYTATAGTLVLRDDKGAPRASMFYVAYVLDGVENPAKRPVTFSFNGGPGSAAVWVQLGAFGPKKVKADDEGMPLPPPGQLVDNPYSALDVSDLVFIDPVSTGFSRAAPGVDAKQFHSLRGDIESVGEFIRLWATRNNRWNSPKFIAGESYGTTRAAGLALFLQQRYGMYLNGLIQISTILNWQNEEIYTGNDTAYLIHLPSYTAAAWYHRKLPAELQRDLRATLKEVEAFAIGEYAAALLQGNQLAAGARRAVAEKLARYSGLSLDFVLRSNLRIHNGRFVKELLRGEGKTIGRLDMRFTGFDHDSAGEFAEYDPSSEAVGVGYVTLLNDHLRRTLKYETDLVYEYSAGLWRNWTWDENTNRYVNVAEDLRRAMTRNPQLKVYFASGYYDLATPYFDTPFSVAHLGLPESLAKNIQIGYFEAGHMMYIRKVDHARFRKEVAEFIRSALGSSASP